jgi:transcriptional regulator with XRE-family HTH domain
MAAVPFDRSRELGAFLRSRRNEIRAARTDATGRTRRVPGLRREEVSTRAGISVDYYTRLEQGREPRPSTQVVEALVRALRLDTGQRRYVYTLAGLAMPPSAAAHDEPLPTAFLALVEDLRMPAFVLGPHLDIVASSGGSRRLFSRFASSNLLEMLFLDEGAPDFFLDWDGCARWAVALLRVLSADATPTEAGIALVARLQAESPEFAALWREHVVDTASTHRVTLRHAELGDVLLHVFALELVDHPDRLVLCRPASELLTEEGGRIRSDGRLEPAHGRGPLVHSILPEPTTR